MTALCEFETVDNRNGTFSHKCRNCGHEGETTTLKWYHPCATYGPPAPGLGDHIANGLEYLGMTKERAGAFTQKWLGVPCGCPERQERLNKLGRYVKMRAAKLGIHLPI